MAFANNNNNNHTAPLTRGSEKKAVLGDGDNPKGKTAKQPNLKINNKKNNNNKNLNKTENKIITSKETSLPQAKTENVQILIFKKL